MTATSRMLSVGVLTFFLLGLAELFAKGQFVVPFPFVGEFCGLMALAVALTVFRQQRVLFSLLFLHGVSGILAGRFVWETFLNFQDLMWLVESGWLDLLRLLSYLTLIAILAFGFGLKVTWFTVVLGVLILGLCAVIAFSGDAYRMLIFLWHVLAGIAGFALLVYKKEEFVFQYISAYLIASGILYSLCLLTILMAGA